MKRVAGLPGQQVCRTGDASPSTASRWAALGGSPRPRPAGLAGPPAHPNGEIFLMNWSVRDSLDGRCFGPIRTSSIIGRAMPVGPTKTTAAASNGAPKHAGRCRGFSHQQKEPSHATDRSIHPHEVRLFRARPDALLRRRAFLFRPNLQAPRTRRTIASTSATKMALRSAPAGSGPARRLASMSRCSSTIRLRAAGPRQPVPVQRRQDGLGLHWNRPPKRGERTERHAPPPTASQPWIPADACRPHLAVLLLPACFSPPDCRSRYAWSSAPVREPIPPIRLPLYRRSARATLRHSAAWILAVMRVESRAMRAISRAGAMGLMQIMPDTWRLLRRRLSSR